MGLCMGSTDRHSFRDDLSKPQVIPQGRVKRDWEAFILQLEHVLVNRWEVPKDEHLVKLGSLSVLWKLTTENSLKIAQLFLLNVPITKEWLK